jgi:hypothetical protein
MAAILRVKHWDDFQHYKAGTHLNAAPKWIKLYARLLDDPVFGQLTAEERFLLIACWLLAARMANAIPASVRWIAGRADLPEPLVEAGLRRLVADGWLIRETIGKSDAEVEATPPPPQRADPDVPLETAGEAGPHQRVVRLCHDIWVARYGGAPPVKKWVRVLAGLLAKHSPEEIARGFEAYCAATQAQYVSMDRYAQTIGDWLTHGAAPSKLGLDPARVIGAQP